MKVVIQIPCFNEEESLPVALRELPLAIPGVDSVEWLVIDDGSKDRTVEVARAHGVHHIVELRRNQGLARAFMAGLDAAVRAGADIVVNTDADNQYCAADIPKLIEPILAARAEIVIGTRPIEATQHFSRAKKLLQRFGSWVVRVASDSLVQDAPSGFRAISRNAALRLRVFNSYTYTIETIIQAAQSGLPLESVPIRTNPDLRPSRLVKSVHTYVFRSLVIIGRVFMVYRPWRFFFLTGLVPFSLGTVLMLRWLILRAAGPFPVGQSHVPSLVASAIFILLGFQFWVVGAVAELLATNRKLIEDLHYRFRMKDLIDSGSISERRQDPR